MNPVQSVNVEPTTIDVRSERGPYRVVIGPGVLRALIDFLPSGASKSPLLIVSSARVWNRHGKLLRDVRGTTPPVLIGDGERAKTLDTVSRIYDALIRRKFDRSATIVAFGGGVVGDVAGFAAATYQRGLRLVQAPTTLLAQVDSAIGGKVGVNLRAGKNQVGSFHSPALVACDPIVLRTLPRRELRSGLYEVVKYGVIASRPLFDAVSHQLDAIFAQDESVLVPIIADCCRIKARVVENDEREAGPRRTLNFGHTIGHALETITNYRRFRHGEAIGYGMIAAARISAARGLLSRDEEARLADVLARMGKRPPVSDLRTADALAAVGHDKKVVAGKLHFVLADGIGRTTIVSDVEESELRAALAHIGLRR